MAAQARRGGWLIGLLAMVVAGCSSDSVLNVSRFEAAFRRHGRGACDGFVFVPTRQAVGGQTIPHATIRIIPIPVSENQPVAEGQADANGFYRFERFKLNQPYVVIATEPWTGGRELQALVSFNSVNEDQRKNLTDITTIAARVYELSGSTEPVTLDQVEALEQICEEVIERRGDAAGITISNDIRDSIAQEALEDSFGALRLTISSEPIVTAEVALNGVVVGQVETAPAASRTEAGLLELEQVLVGTAQVTITAPGFLPDTFEVTVEANETVSVGRQLVPVPGEQSNLPPVVRAATAHPDPVPFEGGQVEILAEVVDPEADGLTVRATVTTPTGGSAQLDMPRLEDDYFVAELPVPGNAEITNQVYHVLIEAVDEPFELPVDGEATGPGRPTLYSFQFSVSGVDPPPPKP